MLRTFAAGLLATALIAGPAFAQTSNSSAKANSAPSPTVQTKMPAAPADTMTAPATTNAKKTHARVVSRSHLKSAKIHQVRHVKPVKSHQAKMKTGVTAKRS